MIDTILDGRYQITDTLSVGGMSQTYIARDIQEPDRPQYVVKHLQPASNKPSFLAQAKRLFQQEATILERLGNHPQIPQLLAYLEEDGQFYLVQEFIEGHTLDNEIIVGQPWEESRTITLLLEILSILQFVHSNNIIHRDIKPENLIRRKDGKLFLIDFGAVKQICTEQSNLTIVIGTQGYMSPEASRGQPVLNSDIYALGKIAIQALTGILPVNLPLDRLGEVIWKNRTKVSPELADFVNKMVQSNFQLRYQSATDAIESLKQLNSSRSHSQASPESNIPDSSDPQAQREAKRAARAAARAARRSKNINSSDLQAQREAKRAARAATRAGRRNENTNSSDSQPSRESNTPDSSDPQPSPKSNTPDSSDPQPSPESNTPNSSDPQPSPESNTPNSSDPQPSPESNTPDSSDPQPSKRNNDKGSYTPTELFTTETDTLETEEFDCSPSSDESNKNQYIPRYRRSSQQLDSPWEVFQQERGKNKNLIKRRRLLKYGTLAGCGAIGTAFVAPDLRDLYQFYQFPPTKSKPPNQPLGIDLQQENFKYVTLDRNLQNISKSKIAKTSYFTEDLGNGISLKLVVIPTGSYVMGSGKILFFPLEKGNEKLRENPQHIVTINKPFAIGEFLITQAQWRQVSILPKEQLDLDPHPSFFEGDSPFQGDRLPVESVSWGDAVEFCLRLSSSTGRKYRLPSEAEWEYACRAGTKTPFHCGETINSQLANYNARFTYSIEPKGEYRKKTTPINTFRNPNRFGLQDMHGNLWEWCSDLWYEDYQQGPIDEKPRLNQNAVKDTQDSEPKQPILDNNLLTSKSPVRGGSWLSEPQNCRSASRQPQLRNKKTSAIGFRVVCTLS